MIFSNQRLQRRGLWLHPLVGLAIAVVVCVGIPLFSQTLSLPKGWREPEALLALARFVAATRPGVSVDEVRAALPDTWRARVDFLPMAGLDISSTALRERVGADRSIRYLTPPAVIQFIQAHRLYKRPGA